jgi:hypothetical protein
MYQDLRELVNKLEIKREKAIKLESGGIGLEHQFEINPDDFLQRAEDDYEQGDSAALLNSITNSKRAIHCQIDQALAVFGFNVRNWNFTRKTELFERLGFVAPRMLRKINRVRNALEHEYTLPIESEVEEALDLAILFVNATCRHLEPFMGEFNIGNIDERVDEFHFSKELRIQFYDEQKSYTVQAAIGVTPESLGSAGSIIGEIYLDAKHEVFKDLIYLTVAGNRENKVEKALNAFFDNLEGI